MAIYRICIPLILLVLQLAAHAVAAAPPQKLFHFMDTKKTDLTEKQSSLIASLKSKKWNENVTIVKLDAARFADDQVVMNLNQELNVTLDRSNVTTTKNKTIWSAKQNDEVNDVTFIKRGDNVTGTIRINNQHFSLRPLSGGLHALIKRNDSKFPPDHPPEFEEAQRAISIEEKQAGDKIEENNLSDTNMSYHIDVMVVYTPAVANVLTDVPSLIDLAIEETNKSYEYSKINASLRLVHQGKVSYTESGSFKTDVDRLAATSDGHIDGVHSLRNRKKADVVVMLINDDQACGRAKTIYANASTAFAICHYDCATGYYSFGHEIGHLQGARHNPEADSTNTPFMYGHGYYNKDKQWRTIMSYNCPGGCVRKRFWSNPNTTYNGDSIGSANKHNNARSLNNTASRIAGFK
ncbi:M12 family metallo-peptidase [Gimesia fumaroli]|uniref:Peptidyl-Asp metalloendopeptidase n=1 Tax=Gimesia fumaroli TaxID=2527976 RepID=A0A518IEP7_9PLAN|nr:M12 family metallo-peptidase [Gimesia fumaroli]QDV51555.1 hypothetical protein Enr17x_36110 [Gimesia fumaroli]